MARARTPQKLPTATIRYLLFLVQPGMRLLCVGGEAFGLCGKLSRHVPIAVHHALESREWIKRGVPLGADVEEYVLTSAGYRVVEAVKASQRDFSQLELPIEYEYGYKEEEEGEEPLSQLHLLS